MTLQESSWKTKIQNKLQLEGGSSISSDDDNSNSVSSNTHTNSKGNKESRVIVIEKFSRKSEDNRNEDIESLESSDNTSSDNVDTNSVNSSSITISQDRESSTIECINRIVKINKELKEKFDKGIKYSDAFIGLIQEFKDQTEAICEAESSKTMFSYFILVSLLNRNSDNMFKYYANACFIYILF